MQLLLSPLAPLAATAGPPRHRSSTMTRASSSHAGTSTVTARRHHPAMVFQCEEESAFYSLSLERVLPTMAASDVVVEFGAGDGAPILNALLKARPPGFPVTIHAFEKNARAAALAADAAAACGLGATYLVHAACFFEGVARLRPTWLIANPPYVPALHAADILLPELHGGEDGAALTNTLLSLEVPRALLLVASISNPLSTLRHARKLGYRVADFTVTSLPFGTYTSEPKIQQHLKRMREVGKAHFTDRGRYLLAGVVFERAASGGKGNGNGLGQGAAHEVAEEVDLADELAHVLTSLGPRAGGGIRSNGNGNGHYH